jgi:hypothetical protein
MREINSKSMLLKYIKLLYRSWRLHWEFVLKNKKQFYTVNIQSENRRHSNVKIYSLNTHNITAHSPGFAQMFNNKRRVKLVYRTQPLILEKWGIHAMVSYIWVKWLHSHVAGWAGCLRRLFPPIMPKWVLISIFIHNIVILILQKHMG